MPRSVMIPLEKPVAQAAAPTESLLSGSFVIRLEALTPLCILHSSPPGPGTESTFAHLGGTRKVVPATSLKGMLRSVHEILTNSRMAIAKTPPPTHAPIGAGQQPSPSDAMFGYAVTGSQDRASTPQARAGRVMLSDLTVTKALKRWIYTIPPPSQHRGASASTGRRVFLPYRAPEEFVEYEPPATHNTIILNGFQGSTDEGEVRFHQLSQDELASLVYALILEDDLVHKLGFGKGQGFGTVRIHIDSLVVESHTATTPPNRFTSSTDSGPDTWTDRIEDLRNAALQAWRDRKGGEVTYQAFREAASWPPTDQEPS